MLAFPPPLSKLQAQEPPNFPAFVFSLLDHLLLYRCCHGHWVHPRDPNHRVLHAACIDMQNFATKIMPEAVTGAKLLQGDGGAGSIRQITFTDALPYSYCNEHIDVLDKENYEFVYKVIEGGDLGTKVSSAIYHIKLEPLADGGCVFKMSSEYTMLPGVDAEEYIAMDKELSIQLFKVVEGYLLANPEVNA